jgi:error-prone DNA polymerase
MPDPHPPKTRRLPDGPVRTGRPAASGRYAELFCKSNFSFLEGASHPEELVPRAAELGLHALAVTDHNTLAGVVRAHVAAKAAGLPLIVGAEVTPEDGPPVVLLAGDRAGYGRLSRLLTLGRRRVPKGECLLTVADIADHAEGLVALAVPTPETAEGPLRRYRGIFGADAHLAVGLHRGPDDQARLAVMLDLSARTRLPPVAVGGVLYHVPERRYLQDVLTCVRLGCTLETAGRRLQANAERHLKSPDEVAGLFAGCPAAVARTVEIAERCTFRLDELRYEYPDEPCPPGSTPLEHLVRLTWEGAGRRWPGGPPAKVRQLIEHELALIAELKYEPYFLTVWDIVRFARSRGILCQGRGSAANSAVCYCLGITAVDPDSQDMLFERFISKERNEPPDIDVDFEHERREEVMQYVYGKYGRERAGIVAEVIRYRTRSAVRDFGKALGLSPDRVDVLAKVMDHWGDNDKLEQRLAEAGLDPREYTLRALAALVRQAEDFPRHLSQHVGGFVITRGRLDEIVPVHNAGMPDRTFIEWDKDDIDALGLMKVDCLALGMLTCIRKCFDLVAQGVGKRQSAVGGQAEALADAAGCEDAPSGRSDCRLPTPDCLPRLSLADIPAADPAVFDMICRADTVGVFQIESRAQMAMLPRMRPRCFYDLVIEVALVRPGPIQGGMVHPYLRRRNGEEQITYPNPAIQQVLHKTLGVPLFQEQAMRLAIVAAGFTPGEADQLRRAMGAWRKRGVIEKFRLRLKEGMLAGGLPAEFADRVFEQIKGFGEYGFPESHAASFARLAWVSAWLKFHHPAAFAAALINSQPMGFYQPAQILRDAREHGVTVLPIDVNCSGWDCTLEGSGAATEGSGGEAHSLVPTLPRGNASVPLRQPRPSMAEELSTPDPSPRIRLGLRLITGLREKDAERLVRERAEGGPFRSMADFVRRTGLVGEALLRLAAADAFGSLGLDRRSAVWMALRHRCDDDLPLFAGLDPAEPDPKLPAEPMTEQVAADYRTTGLSLKAHPVGLVRDRLDAWGLATAAQVAAAPDGARLATGGLVLVRQRPSTAKGITFVTLEDETGVVNLIIRPDVFAEHRTVARAAAGLMAAGRVQKEGLVVHLIADRLEDLCVPLAGAPRSRDFH